MARVDEAEKDYIETGSRALMNGGRRALFLQFSTMVRMLKPANWFRAKAWLQLHIDEGPSETGLLLLKLPNGELVDVADMDVQQTLKLFRPEAN